MAEEGVGPPGEGTKIPSQIPPASPQHGRQWTHITQDAGWLNTSPPILTKAHRHHPQPSPSLDDEGGAVELVYKEGQDSSFLVGWLGLERLGAQAVTQDWLHSIRHEEAAQDLRHIVPCQWDFRHLFPQDL